MFSILYHSPGLCLKDVEANHHVSANSQALMLSQSPLLALEELKNDVSSGLPLLGIFAHSSGPLIKG